MGRSQALLDIRSVVKHYRLGSAEPIRAIDGVSLTIEAGEFVVLYGPSGSGKSTLIDLVAGVLQPHSGTIHFNGRDLAVMSSRELDDFRLHDLGVIGSPENLTEGATALEEASLRLCLTNTRNAESGIVELMDRLGLGSRLYHHIEELSMGERERVMIAMALATNPALVLADEPTGNLDSGNSENVLRLLQEVCEERGAALLLATHDPQAASFADQLHELHDGRLRPYRPTHILVPTDSVGEET
jgi:putative ABC transport system ATP-binding protein